MNDEVRITLRMPADLRDSILSAASGNERSINAEIVTRLRETFANRGEDDVASLLRLALSKVEMR